MKYLLTLEKFQSNILTKINMLMKSDADFNFTINNIMDDHSINLSKITDDYFEYEPTNRVIVKPKPVKKGVVFDTTKVASGYSGKFEVGQVWEDSDGDIDTIIDLNRRKHSYVIIGDVYGSWTNSDDNRGEYNNEGEALDSDDNDLVKFITNTPFKVDQTWEDVDGNQHRIVGIDWNSDGSGTIYYESGIDRWGYPKKNHWCSIQNGKDTYVQSDLTGTRISPFLIKKISDKKIPRKEKVTANKYANDKYIFMWFSTKNKLVSVTKYNPDKENDQSDNFNLGRNEGKVNDSDYVIIFNINKAEKNISDVSDIRTEREGSRKGATALITDEEVLKMNQVRFRKALADKYTGELSNTELEMYSNFKKVLMKVFRKNPLAIILNDKSRNSLGEYVNHMIKVGKSLSDPYNYGEINQNNIDKLKSSIMSLFDLDLVNKKMDFHNLQGSNYGNEDDYERYLKIFLENFEPIILEIQSIIYNKIKDDDFDMLIDLESFIHRINIINSYSEKGSSEIYKIKSSYYDLTNKSPRYSFSYYFDEYLYDEKQIKDNLKRLLMFKRVVDRNL